MSADEFRRAAAEHANWIANYFEHVRDFPVVPQIKPGDLKHKLPASGPETWRVARSDSFRFRYPDLPCPDPLESSPLLCVVFYFVVRTSDTRRNACGGSERQRNALEVIAGCNRARRGHPRLAARVAGARRRLVRHHLRHCFRRSLSGARLPRASTSIPRAARKACVPDGWCMSPNTPIHPPRRPPWRSASGKTTSEKSVSTLNFACGRICSMRLFERIFRRDKRPCAVVATVGTTSTASIDPVVGHRRNNAPTRSMAAC